VHLYEALAQRVEEWHKEHYPNSNYPAIAEILEWAADPETTGWRLRIPQLRALEVYWYLRLVENTPHIYELYQRYFQKQSERIAALGVSDEAFKHVEWQLEELLRKIKEDDMFVRRFKLEAVRETLKLEYPSYIFALAMGAGKTALIGAIFATEFAMALEYPRGPFVQNALVFAPGKTILESLRQLVGTPYDRILPPRMFKQFASSVKITFTRDGEKDIHVVRKSRFNVVVTNTEKIRIQKETIKKSDLGRLLAPEKMEAAKAEVANLRLQAIASLPHLAVFSDEAHHTYGQSLQSELKKVRKTVDYLASNTNVICVVNTTGTPYFRRQPLRDVVIWYGLAEGIENRILKRVAENIKAYSFDTNIEGYVGHVIEDFFKDYGGVSLPDGTPAKLAMYFPQTDDVAALRPAIDSKLIELKRPPTLVFEHHTKNENKADFDRFKLKSSPHRIALLVDRGVEGWDVPALFACALARRLRTSNNFVLQAASRCLREVPGNSVSARIYLSNDNRSILDRELRENYGERLEDLTKASSPKGSAIIQLRKFTMPPLVIRQHVRRVVRKNQAAQALKLTPPKVESSESLRIATLTLVDQRATRSVLQQVSDTVEVRTAPRTVDIYSATVELAAAYHVDLWEVYDELRRIYDVSEIPILHLPDLSRQIEEQTRNYETQEEIVDVALALVKPNGFERSFDASGTEVYTAEISYPLSREHLLVRWEDLKDRTGEFGFHYSPYNFDSRPELSFFEQILIQLNLSADQIEDIYFTGAITNPRQTDFYVEYKATDDTWHRYTPDFVIRRKDGKCLIVEVKSAQFETATTEDLKRHDRKELALTTEGRKAVAVKKWQLLDPERLKYEIIFESSDTVGFDKIEKVREFIRRS